MPLPWFNLAGPRVLVSAVSVMARVLVSTFPGVNSALRYNRLQNALNDRIPRLKSKLGKAKSRHPDSTLEVPRNSTSNTMIHNGIEMVEIKSDDGTFELSVSNVEDPRRNDWDSSSAKISRLGPLVSGLIPVGVATHLNRTNYMIVEKTGNLASGKLLPAKDGDGSRGIIVDDDGNWIGHAKLHDSPLTKVMNLTQVWAVVSFFVAQKHLHDISQNLTSISADISKISEFQQNERLSGIVGDYHYLVELVERLEYSPEAMEEKKFDVVEDIYRQAFSSHNHLLTDIRNVRVDSENVEAASAGLQELNYLLAQVFLVFQVRILCFKLQEMFNPDTHTIANRLGRLGTEINKIAPLVYKKFDDFLDREVSVWEKAKHAIGGGVGPFDSSFERMQVFSEIETSSDKFEVSFDHLAKTYNDMSRAVFSIANPKQQLLLKIDGDRIVGISDCN